MKIKNVNLLMLIFLFLGSSVLKAQTSNPTVNIEGSGYLGSGLSKKMILTSSTGSSSNLVTLLNNTEIKIENSGLYEFTISCGVNGNDILSQNLGYNLNINNALSVGIGYGNLPSSGNYVFRKNLNLGDIITINVNKNFDFPTNTGNNKVKIEKIQ